MLDAEGMVLICLTEWVLKSGQGRTDWLVNLLSLEMYAVCAGEDYLKKPRP